MRHRLALAVATIAACATVVPSAAAVTYCVHQTGTCPAGQTDSGADLQAALTAAQNSTGTADAVLVGPGTYTGGPYTYSGGLQRLDLVGSGASGVNATVIKNAAGGNGVHAMTLQGGASSPLSLVSDLSVEVPGGNSSQANFGLRATTFDLTRVNASIPGTLSTPAAAVTITGGTYAEGDVTGPVGGSLSQTAVILSSDAILQDSLITAHQAVQTTGPATVRRVTASGRTGVNVGPGSGGSGTDNVLVEDVAWRSAAGLTDATGLQAFCSSTRDVAVTARNLTLVNDYAGAGSRAVHAGCNFSGRESTVNLSSSIARGGVVALRASAASGAKSTLNVSYSNFPSSDTAGAGNATLNQGAGNVNADPAFVGPTNLRLLESSPMIDAGDPSGLAAGESQTDRDGNPRIVAVRCPLTARRDMGAYEFQTAPASCPAAAAPAAGTPPAATPPAATPAAGQTAAPDKSAPGIGGTKTDPPVFAVAPGATPTMAVRRGTRFRFRLTEPATVGLRIEKALPGRRVGRSCRKPSRRRGGKRCTRWRHAGTLVRRNRPAGANTVPFSGRIGRKALRPGRYRVVLTAQDAAGNRSKPSRARFRVVRG
jgi:hypothetical protein